MANNLLLEDYLPLIRSNGSLKSNISGDFSGASSMALPTSTTVGGVLVTPGGGTGMSVLATVDSINGKTLATTDLYTTPIGKTAIIVGVTVRVTSFTSGGKSINALFTFGTNASSYDNYYDTNGNSNPFTAVNQAALIMGIENMYGGTPAVIPVCTAGTVFKMKVTTASNATTEIYSVDVLGYTF